MKYTLNISIHAPRMGSDKMYNKIDPTSARFQSTLPAWGATFGMSGSETKIYNFNPRSPHGERQRRVGRCRLKSQFQSTLPAWGAT